MYSTSFNHSFLPANDWSCLFTEYNDMKSELTEYLREFVAQGKVRKFDARFELRLK